MKKYTPVLAVLVSVSLLYARQEQRSCASHADKWREELQLHRQAQAGQLKAKAALRRNPPFDFCPIRATSRTSEIPMAWFLDVTHTI